MNLKNENKNWGALGDCLKFLLADEKPAGADSEESEKGSDATDASSVEKIGEMVGLIMSGKDFEEMANNPQFKKIVNDSVKSSIKMLESAVSVINELPEENLTVEEGIAEVAKAAKKKSTRLSSHEFSGFVIYPDKKMAMEIMTKMYDGLSGVQVIWLTFVLIEEGWILPPNPESIIDAFNVSSFCKQLYSGYRSVSVPQDDKTAILARLSAYVKEYLLSPGHFLSC